MSTSYYRRHRDKILSQKREYQRANKDKIRAYQASYYQRNKERKKLKVKQRYYLKKHEIINSQVKYRAARRATDPLFKLKHNIRSLISSVLRRKNFSKKSKTAELLGCSWDQFKKHIEDHFDHDMNWDNYGTFWTYDHVCPVSQALNEEELLKLQNYLNIRPCKYNRVKSNNKTPEGEQMCLLLLGRKWTNKGEQHDKLKDQDQHGSAQEPTRVETS